MAFAETSLRTREVGEDIVLRKVPGILVWNATEQTNVADRKLALDQRSGARQTVLITGRI